MKQRIIKFRAWDKRHNLFRGDNKVLDRYERLAILNSEDFHIMQYTGLKDKNGKEGYFEDIVKFAKSYSKGYGKEEVQEFTGIIKENKYFHSCIMVGTTEFHIDNLLKGEIIGDGYRNPELLKAVKP